MARAIVPHSRRAQLRRLYNHVAWPLYLGRRFACNCCGGRFRRFQSWTNAAGVSQPMCPRCGSLGRHRTEWFYLSQHPDLLSGPKRVLHVAPEESLERCLRRLPGVDYLSADFDAKTAMEHMDITDIQHPDSSFDVIICNHVLEHVADDRRALSELFRVLSDDGWALLQAPIDDDREATLEDTSITGPADRERVFGQYDHVRVYGRDYVGRLEAAGFVVSVDDVVRGVPEQQVELYQLEPELIHLGRKLSGSRPPS
jgi:SAM-dependent methyltransferase